MLIIRTAKRDKLIREGEYVRGVNKGYELGYLMRQTEDRNKGFIIGSRVSEQLNEILKDKGI